MRSRATNVDDYLAELPAERRRAIAAVRAVILKNLDKDYEEGMSYGMISYHVPHRVYPPGYHCDPKQPLPFAGLASQKQYMSVYLMSIYNEGAELAWFRREWARSGKKLDMGKCCVRFRKLDDLPLELIGEAIRRVPAKRQIAQYEAAIGSALKRPPRRSAATAAAKRAKPKRATRATGRSARTRAPVARKRRQG